MSMFYTDDPVADFHRYDAEQQAMLDKLPLCSECKNRITTEFAYYIHGEWYCEECINDFRQLVPED